MKINKFRVFKVSSMYFIQAILKSILPLFFVYLFNKIGEKEYRSVLVCLLLQLILWVIFVYFNTFLTNTEAYENEKIKNELKYDLIIKMGKQRASDINSDKVLSFSMNDLEDVITNYVTGIYNLTECIFLMIFSSISLLYFNYIVFLTCIAVSIFSYYVPQLFVKKLNINQKEINNAQSFYLKKIKNLFGGLMIFVYANKKKSFSNALTFESINLKDEYLKTYDFKRYFLSLKDFISKLSNTILFGTVYILIYFGVLSFGVIFAVMDVFTNFNQSIVEISSLIANIKVGRKILDKFDREIVTNDENMEIIGDIKEISIQDCNINFEKNKKYLVVGKSGSGKSTLIKRILGLVNYGGLITINKKDIKNICMKKIYDKIEYIDDENKLLYANIYDNISLFSKCDKDKIDKILTMLNLENIKKDEILKNTNLSVGEIQRINLARIMYDEKDILILDEALANIDSKNASIVNKYLNERENTLIYITHHMNDDINFDCRIEL